MKIINTFSTFTEVPTKNSICISAFGCPHKCKGCSWQGENKFREFTIEDLKKMLVKYKGLADCICFLGGEWNKNFKDYLKVCKDEGYETCLYTGLDEIKDNDLLINLDYLKTGHWDETLGGLNKKTTNQKFINVHTNEILNSYFWSK